ncbi:MAG TPA: hypothetical protein VH950_10395 [Gaiellaceae bacterium]|jgi:hypothetical protein
MKNMRALGVVIAACAAALLLATASSAAGFHAYTDPAGDGQGAPDIRHVSVSNDDKGRIAIRITVDALVRPSDAVIGIAVDADQDARTGAQALRGAEYAITLDASDNSFELQHWDGAAWVDAPSKSVEVYSDTTGVEISMSRSELGKTDGFDFWVRSTTLATRTGPFENAPDRGAWRYHLDLSTPSPTLRRALIPLNWLAPKAGRLYTFRVPYVQLGSGVVVKPHSVVCSAKLAGVRIRGTGEGACVWKLVASTKGRTLVVTADISFRGVTERWIYPLRVG